MTTLCWNDYTPEPGTNVRPIHYTPEGRARGVKLAAYLAAQRHGLPVSTCLQIRDRAVGRVRAGYVSPAMAVARAEAEARQAARSMTGGDAA